MVYKDKSFIRNCINGIKQLDLIPQELCNPGLMDGYGGIVYYFIEKWWPNKSE